MTLVPFTECCLHLGIDPKTLRSWLSRAHLACCVHPADARVKCLTADQLSQLARLHDRRLPLQAAPASEEAQETSTPAPSASQAKESSEIAELRHHLAFLQAQVSTLQVQVTELALALVRGGGSFPSVPAPAPPLPSASPNAPRAAPRAPRVIRPAQPVPSSRSRAPQIHSRAIPLIEVRSDGTPVVISPTEGVLPLVADAPDWFAWLASLKSFSFRCVHGHFHANRRFDHGQPVQFWNLRQSLHGCSAELYLGPTHSLTLSRLQERATLLHARLTSS